MEVSKFTDSHFQNAFYANKLINFNNPPRYDFASADSETHLYYNDELLSEESAANYMKECGQTWCKENIEVRPWAFMLYVEDLFLCFDNIEDFMMCCATLRLTTVVWYNAKFDFSLFDYYFLTHGWKDSHEVVAKELYGYRYGKLGHKTYASLHNDKGARYKLTIWHKYYNKNKDYKVHRFDMVDLVNVMQGGLKANLKSWDVRDADGNPIRKLEMDYVNDKLEDCVQYLINDTMGLYYLTKMFDNEFRSICDLSFVNGDFLTSGGVAKKMLLTKMYGKEYKDSLKLFQKDFPITIEMDEDFRDKHLYMGGKTLVNPKYRGKIVSGIYKLDVNSMYPHKMATMKLPYGLPEMIDDYVKDDNYIQILHITNMFGVLKKNMVGVWYDFTNEVYTDTINEDNDFYIFSTELEELMNWYDLDYEYDFVYRYKTTESQGMKDFIYELYDIKCTSKGSRKLAVKIPLNASYGKLAERVIRVVGEYQLSENGYVHFVKLSEKTSTKGMMNVVIGSLVTSLARTDLMKKIREVTDNNPYENFIYCDTDSIHAKTHNCRTDDTELGVLKIESFDKKPYDKALYIAPKSYIMIHDSYYNKEIRNEDSLVVHCKGVNTGKVRELLLQCNTIEEMAEIFRPNYPIRCLMGLNAIGGKALIYKDKYILREDPELVGDMLGGEDSGFFYEV